MKLNTIFIQIIMLITLFLMGAWSCSGKPFYPPVANEIPKGAGVYTKGEDGTVLYDSTKEHKQSALPSPAPEVLNENTEKSFSVSDYEDFEAYRQWLQWKKSAAGTPEYAEFQLWREWQKYQEWNAIHG
jgi:hypothetical protein